MLKDRAQKLPATQARPLLEKASKLIGELKEQAHDNNDKKALVRYDEVLTDIKSSSDALAKKRFFNFWPFSRK